MSKFKVGDRVKTTASCEFSFKDETGTVREEGIFCHTIEFDKPVGNTTKRTKWTCQAANLTLINEDKMTYTDTQIRDALSDSVTHWRKIVGVFAITQTGDDRAAPDTGSGACALCRLIMDGGMISVPECRAHCPVNSCSAGSLWAAVNDAATNHAAWVASKAMLARLEELLAEYDAKVKDAENDIRVGDIVVCKLITEGGMFERKVSQAGLKNNLCEVTGVNGRCKLRLRSHQGSEHWDNSEMVLVYRPAAKGK